MTMYRCMGFEAYTTKPPIRSGKMPRAKHDPQRPKGQPRPGGGGDEIDPPFVTLARFSPIPGTPYYNELEAQGRIHPGIDWFRETNQRLDTDYLLDMPAEEFDSAFREVSEIVMARNAAKSAELGARDGRLKG